MRVSMGLFNTETRNAKSFRDFLSKVSVTILLAFMAPQSFGFIINPNVDPWLDSASGTRSGNGVGGTLTWSLVPDGSNVDDGNSNLGGSDLIDFLNDNFDGDPAVSDHREQPWFPIIESSLDRWSELSGLDFIYEPNDDGVARNTQAPGVLGVRGDLRFSGVSVDGRGGVLAFNFFPQFGGDMTIDTDETGFARGTNNFNFFRTTIMHELGHAIGLDHVTSTTDNLLMDAFADPTIDGPQLDDIRGIQFYFGDRFEASNDGLGNGTVSRATDLGELVAGGSLIIGADADVPSQAIDNTATDFVSISQSTDTDYYSFTITQPGEVFAELTPHGGVFTQADEFERNPSTFDANARIDLAFSILDTNGTTSIEFADDVGAGDIEVIETTTLDPGTYYARVTGDEDTIQLYSLDLRFESAVLLGDCNGDGVVNSPDLECGCSTDIGEVLTALNATPGDFDLDGDVDFADFLNLSGNFGEDGDYLHGDIDCSGEVDFPDFLALAIGFGQSTASTASVPEPNAALLGLLSGSMLLTLRRKRQASSLPRP